MVVAVLAVLVVIIVVAAVSMAWALIGGWMFMLAVGVAHHEWLPTLPTIGYWWAVLLVLLVRLAFLDLPTSSKD